MRDTNSLAELANQFGVHCNLVGAWKRQLIEMASAAFNAPAARKAMRDKYHRAIELSHQTTQDEESWMMDVLQGRISAEYITNALATTLDHSDVERLYWCVVNNIARYRTRALAMLAHKKGIRKSTICHFLRVGSHYVDRAARHYQAEGVRWFSKHGQSGQRKHELERYQKAVFAILHSPPSAHGINRTTWRRKDIKPVLFTIRSGFVAGVFPCGGRAAGSWASRTAP